MGVRGVGPTFLHAHAEEIPHSQLCNIVRNVPIRESVSKHCEIFNDGRSYSLNIKYPVAFAALLSPRPFVTSGKVTPLRSSWMNPPSLHPWGAVLPTPSVAMAPCCFACSCAPESKQLPSQYVSLEIKSEPRDRFWNHLLEVLQLTTRRNFVHWLA